MRKYGGSRACGMCGNGGAAGLLQGCPLWEVPFARADDRIGPPRGLVVGCRLCAVSRSRPQCRAGVFARRLGFAAAQGFRDDASIVPYEAQDKALPGVTGYLWGKAAMHPSVCAFRRSHRPVCGARIARRALKHACALRPLHLLRLAFSAAGGARLRSPLQGRLSNSCPPKVSPVRGGGIASAMTEGYGAWPCQYPSVPPQTFPALRHYRTRGAALAQNRSIAPPQLSPAGVNARPTIIGHTGGKTGNSKAPLHRDR